MIDKNLAFLMFQNGHNYTDIAKELGCSKQRIHQLITGYKTLKHSNAKKHICGICRQPAVAIHHKDGNSRNNNPLNLLPVCKNCHIELHLGKPHRRKKKVGVFIWSYKYTQCQKCKSTGNKHYAKGLCTICYGEMNRQRFRKRHPHYWKEYRKNR